MGLEFDQSLVMRASGVGEPTAGFGIRSWVWSLSPDPKPKSVNPKHLTRLHLNSCEVFDRRRTGALGAKAARVGHFDNRVPCCAFEYRSL